jgi:4-hydroxybenzoate polyprenyltransferase/phosphoserine phosphatase
MVVLTAAAAKPAADAPGADPVPLVVDLDGTLLRTDTLVESLFALGRRHPLRLLVLPLWLGQGRAALKHRLASLAPLDVHTLPTTQGLLEYLRAERRNGRRLVLATGADEQIARAVAGELGCFDAVLASDGVVNLSGERKRDRLVAEFGEHGFDYAGNSARDLPVWAAARRGLLIGATPHVAVAAQRVTMVDRAFEPERPNLGTYLAAMRVQHWLKNLLLLVPLLAAHRIDEPALLARALLGLVCFCLAASGVYLLNDLFDLPADRRHPHKKARALASGRMPVLHALLLVPGLWLVSALLSLSLSPSFIAALGVYAALMLAYSMSLKDIAIIDTLALAAGYTLRIYAGSLAAEVAVSPWLLVCSSALFFGLALLKRYAELVTLRSALGAQARIRGYRVDDAALIAGLGTAAGCIAVVVLALYPVVEPSGQARWPVWLLCALLLFWTGHMWLMAHHGRIHDDPVAFALRDPLSRALGVITLGLLVLGT